jgi:decaprenylphospho-beta-D-erythro-pentofuranosid-2-ulose 2-reductase
MNTKTVLILGAASDMARALAHRYAQAGWHIHLAARRAERLQADCSDLRLRYQVEAQAWEFDAAAYEQHSAFWEQISPKPELVICVFGLLGDQVQAESDWSQAEAILAVNYVGAVSILQVVANHMQTAESGTIVGISSVAGDRGRGSNYFYGSAKAGFSAFLSGLRNRLYPQGVHVLTVKPGYVRTAMTEGMKLPTLITASPEQVAQDIFRAVEKKQNVLYTRWMWRYLMLIIRLIPEPIFKQLKL